MGQDLAKRRLAVSVHNHYKRITSKIEDEVEIEKSNVLLINISDIWTEMEQGFTFQSKEKLDAVFFKYTFQKEGNFTDIFIFVKGDALVLE